MDASVRISVATFESSFLAPIFFLGPRIKLAASNSYVVVAFCSSVDKARCRVSGLCEIKKEEKKKKKRKKGVRGLYSMDCMACRKSNEPIDFITAASQTATNGFLFAWPMTSSSSLLERLKCKICKHSVPAYLSISCSHVLVWEMCTLTSGEINRFLSLRHARTRFTLSA